MVVFKKILIPAPKNLNVICSIEIDVAMKQTVLEKVGQLAFNPLLDPLTFLKIAQTK